MDVTGWAGLGVAAGVLAAATGLGLWWRRRDGRPQPAAAASPGEPVDPAISELLTSLGVTAGSPVTLLQFSSAFCAPCRATRVLCGRLAADSDQVRHVEVDAESQLAAVRALAVWRTPTVFVLDSAGRPVSRITGQPTSAQLTEAVAPLLPQAVRP